MLVNDNCIIVLRIFFVASLVCLNSTFATSQRLLQQFDRGLDFLCGISPSGNKIAFLNSDDSGILDVYTLSSSQWEFSNSIQLHEQLLSIDFLTDELLFIAQNDEAQPTNWSQGKSTLWKLEGDTWVTMNRTEHFMCTDFNCVPQATYDEDSGKIGIVRHVDENPIFTKAIIDLYSIDDLQTPYSFIDLENLSYRNGFNIDFSLAGDSLFILSDARLDQSQETHIVKTNIVISDNSSVVFSDLVEEVEQFSFTQTPHYIAKNNAYLYIKSNILTSGNLLFLASSECSVLDSFELRPNDYYIDMDIKGDKFIIIEEARDSDLNDKIKYGSIENDRINILYEFELEKLGFKTARLANDGNLLLISNDLGGFDLYDMSSIGLDNIETLDVEFDIYPNPVLDLLHYKVPSGVGIIRFYIYDLSGQTLKTCDLGINQSTVDLSFLEPGIYIADFQLSDSSGFRHTFVKIDR
jgi:hypothetical protein